VIAPEQKMQISSGLIDRYVAVWNEPDRDARRCRIESVWAPGGTTCYRLLDAHGYEAIEARVAGSWERWLREGKYTFRPVRAVSHRNAIKFEFAMVATGDGKAKAQGLCYLLLDADGRIAQDYQFNPSIDEAADLTKRYLAPWNEPDAGFRRSSLAALWARDCTYFDAKTQTRGLEQLSRKVTDAHRSFVGKGHVLAPADRSQRHHDVAHIGWRIPLGDGRAGAVAGSTLLIMDGSGRIATGYQFDDGMES
jgi:hypothetical protein